MQAYWTLTRRELAGFFLSITGYVIIAAAAFLIGLSFLVLLKEVQNDPQLMPVTEIFYNTQFFWLILLLAVPVITMRLFALEKFSGTFETLMTTPVKDSQVVAAKFTAAMIFYMVLWVPLLACLLLVHRYTNTMSLFDPGVVGSTFIGILLLGGMFVSLGCFASSLTRSQMTAAMISLLFSISLFLLSFLAGQFPAGRWQAEVLAWFDLPDQMHDFARGLVDSRPIILYVSVAALFLFLTLRVVESRRWK